MPYRMMIVDDEPYIRKGIIAKIDCSKFDIRIIDEASDGEEAIAKFKEASYDLVITDIKMPEMDGTELIEQLKKLNHECKFAIVSGHANFDYAKRALGLGINAYILKPIDPIELETALKKMIDEIISDDEVRYILNDSLESVERTKIDVYDRILSSLIIDKTEIKCDYGDWKKLIKKYNTFSVGILQYKIINDDVLEGIMYYDIRGLLDKALSKYDHILFFRNHKTSDEFVMIIGHEEVLDDKNQQKDVMETLVNNLARFHNLNVVIGISDKVEGITRLWQSYYQAYIAVSEKILKGYGKVYSFSNIRNTNNRIKLTDEKRRVFLTYLNKGNQKEVNIYMDKLIRDILSLEDLSYINVKDICEFIYICTKDYLMGKGYNADIILGERFDFSNEVLKFDRIDQVKEWIKTTVDFAMNKVSKLEVNSGEDVVEDCIRFMEENYHLDLTLSLISKKYHINQNYFCRIFKIKTGYTFNEYLTSIRMDRAKEMILSASLKIGEVATLCGYNEPKYFSKVFKKEFGVTPSQYPYK